MRRALPLLIALGLGLASCSDDDESGMSSVTRKRSTTTETTLSPPTTHAPADPATYAVPPVIDKAYIEHVIAGIDHVQGDALRILVAKKTHIDEDWQKKMQATTTDDEFDSEVGLAERIAADGFSQLRPIPGDVTTTVTKISTATPTCIFVEVDRDASAQLSVAGPERPQRYVHLVRSGAEPFAAENPTGWIIALSGYNSEGGTLDDQCA